MEKKVEKAFNTHLNAEFYSSYLYLSMANYFAANNLEGMLTWMRIQVDEERMHAMKFIDFINNRGGRVVLEKIHNPKTDWPSPRAAFDQALQHALLVTKKINDLVDLAIKENDHAAASFLQWFINEQVEEEAVAQAIVSKLALIKDNSMGLLMIDQQLGQRVPAAAAAAGAAT